MQRESLNREVFGAFMVCKLRKGNVLWLWVPIAIVVLLIAQYWTGSRVKAKTQELRNTRQMTYDVALELTQALGYGGLVYHFHSFLLRPHETGHLESARIAASSSEKLVRELELNAGILGMQATLPVTHDTIDGYRLRLERITPLSNYGMSSQQMDQVLRMDDQFALREISTFLDQLSDKVEQQLKSIVNQGAVLRLISLTGTFAFSMLFLWMFIQRRNRIAYMQSIATLNAQLGKSNTRLSEANASLKQFAGIISHDLKSPLRHIALFNEQILEEISDQKAIQQHTGMIHKSVLRMHGLIGGLLDFTHTGFKNPEVRPLDIHAFILGVLGEFESTIRETGASVSVEASGTVSADTQLLNRVFVNLLDNSFKFVSPETPPVITIVANPLLGEEAGNHRVCISDNGIGIPVEQSKRVFEPMARLHSNQSEYAGIGIGLSLARAIVNAHSGQIAVAEDYREGTRICFTLPTYVQSVEA